MLYTYIFISCLVLILTSDWLTTFKKIDTYFMFDVSSVMYFTFDVTDYVTMATATALTITLWTRVLSLAALTNSSISGPRFLDIKLTFYQYRKSHCGISTMRFPILVRYLYIELGPWILNLSSCPTRTLAPPFYSCLIRNMKINVMIKKWFSLRLKASDVREMVVWSLNLCRQTYMHTTFLSSKISPRARLPISMDCHHITVTS